MLMGDSVSALGWGELSVRGAPGAPNAPSALKLGGKYTQLSGPTTLELDLGGAAAASQGSLARGKHRDPCRRHLAGHVGQRLSA